MTDEPTQPLTGTELDRAVAGEVMGWAEVEYGCCAYGPHFAVGADGVIVLRDNTAVRWRPSQDWSTAGAVLTEIQRSSYTTQYTFKLALKEVALKRPDGSYIGWSEIPLLLTPHTVCEAAVQAVRTTGNGG